MTEFNWDDYPFERNRFYTRDEIAEVYSVSWRTFRKNLSGDLLQKIADLRSNQITPGVLLLIVKEVHGAP